jgi:hypothetical protein
MSQNHVHTYVQTESGTDAIILKMFSHKKWEKKQLILTKIAATWAEKHWDIVFDSKQS